MRRALVSVATVLAAFMWLSDVSRGPFGGCFRGVTNRNSAWPALSDRTDTAFKAISEGASAHNAVAAHGAAEMVKGQYFDLLRILSQLE